MSKIWTPPSGRRQNKHSFPNESRVERWFGKQSFAQLADAVRGCSIPVPILQTPNGDVIYAHRDVGFLGRMAGGGFTSLSDLIAEATGGKRQDFMYQKVGVTDVANASHSLWRVGNLPVAGAAVSALAAGIHYNNISQGAPGLVNPGGSDTMHLTTGFGSASVVPNLNMLYDRLWAGLLSTGTGVQTCTLTGYPASSGRYSGTTPGAANSARGNFMFVVNESAGVLAAVAHTHTVLYTDDEGTTGRTTAAISGNSGCIVGRIDHPTTSSWWLPLASDDYGVADIESIQVGTNAHATNFPAIVLAHPLALIPFIVASQPVVLDGINSMFNLVEFKPNCCPALLEINRAATTATTYTGQHTVVSG